MEKRQSQEKNLPTSTKSKTSQVSLTKKKSALKKSDEKLGPSSASATCGPVVRKSGGAVAKKTEYTKRALQPAKNYDAVSFGRAMNKDFGSKVQKLFNSETEAAWDAIKTGVYIGWRCLEYKHDCQRIGKGSKCFCGHLLNEHDSFTGVSVEVPCKSDGCTCKAFSWIPSKPSEVGEYWHERRPGFDLDAWRIKCRCKHSHEEHDPRGAHRCKTSGCSCSAFNSASVCAACDKQWEQHETFFETAQVRQRNGLPVGEDYIPFAEIPSLKKMVLTGVDDEDMSYMRVQRRKQDAIGNLKEIDSSPFAFGAGTKNSGFKPSYE